jgi:tol-pal system-associated acyl-CoA thioesterase
LAAVTAFDWQVRVYYEDTDAGGVVYHSQYLNFLERARTEWLRHLGFEHTYLKETFNLVFVVHSIQIVFKKPAKLSDLLTISSALCKIGRGSFEFLQKITVNQQLLIEAQVKLACVDAMTFRPTAIPEQIKSTMEKI